MLRLIVNRIYGLRLPSLDGNSYIEYTNITSLKWPLCLLTGQRSYTHICRWLSTLNFVILIFLQSTTMMVGRPACHCICDCGKDGLRWRHTVENASKICMVFPNTGLICGNLANNTVLFTQVITYHQGLVDPKGKRACNCHTILCT